MRTAISAVLGLFLASTLLGCGGATIPEPPGNAKGGPPPGASADLTKIEKKKK